MQTESKQKIPKKGFELFFDYKKESTNKSRVDKETDFAGEFKEMYRFTLQWVRLRQHLLNVQYRP